MFQVFFFLNSRALSGYSTCVRARVNVQAYPKVPMAPGQERVPGAQHLGQDVSVGPEGPQVSVLVCRRGAGSLQEPIRRGDPAAQACSLRQHQEEGWHMVTEQPLLVPQVRMSPPGYISGLSFRKWPGHGPTLSGPHR